MKKIYLCLFAASVAFQSWAASVTTDPSPAVINRPVTVTVTTGDNYVAPVYIYTWINLDGQTYKPSGDWDGAINDKFKMTGSGKTWSYYIDDIVSFYGIPADKVSKVTQIGVIARTTSTQTADLFFSVEQAPLQRYSGGEGTVASPYQIATAQDLKELSTTTDDWAAGICFEQTADINASGLTATIGNVATPFKGSYNGNGHSVSNLNLTETTVGQAAGLFGVVDGGTITALGVIDENVSGSTYTGGLVGLLKSGSVSRCFTTGTVTGSSVCCGGLVGENNATVTDCYSTAAVVNNSDYATGGLVGKNTGTVTNTIATGEVSGHDYVGGLVGANYGTVKNSFAVNSSITSYQNYAARFGGNNNSENIGSGNHSWTNITTGHPAWTEYGDHATTQTALTLSKESSFKELSDWDFNNVWEWKTENAKASPVLRSLDNQSAIYPVELYASISGVETIAAGAAEITAAPNPTEGMLTVTAPSAISNCRVLSLDGQLKSMVEGEGETLSLDLSALPTGLYLLEVTLEGNSAKVIKVIKK